MGETAKVLTIRLRTQDDGSVVLERSAKAIAAVGAASDHTATSVQRLSAAEREAAAAASSFVATMAAKSAGVAALGSVANVGAVSIEKLAAVDAARAVALVQSTAATRQAQAANVVFWSNTDRLRDAIDHENAAHARRATALSRGAGMTSAFKQATVDATVAAGNFSSILERDVTQLTIYGGIIASVGAATGVYLVKRGLEQNAVMEQSRLGMAALVSALGEITDTNGDVLRGQERWNAALHISEDLQKRMKIAALETTASYKDLVRVMQEGLGPMLQAGISDPDKIINFVQTVAQTGGALGIPGDRMGQEIRSLLRGERGPDNQLSNALLSDVSKQRFDQLVKEGKIYDFLIEKMSSFKKAGAEAATTLSGAWSNLNDAIDQVLGEGTAGTAKSTAAALGDLTRELVVLDENGKQVFNPEFVKGVNLFGDGLVFVANSAVLLAEKLPTLTQKLKDYWEAVKRGPNAATKDIEDERAHAEAQDRLAHDREARQAGQVFLTDTRKGLTLPKFITSRDEVGPHIGNTLDRRDIEMEIGRFSLDHGFAKDAAGAAARKRFHDLVAGYVADGKLTIADLREAERKFEAESANVGPKIGTKPKVTPATAEQASQMRKMKDAYLLDVDDFEREAGSAGDPLAQALDKIESARQKKIASLEEQREKLKGILGADSLIDDLKRGYNALAANDAQNTSFAFAAQRSTIPQLALHALGQDPISMQAKETALRTQREIEDGRLALMKQSAVRQHDLIEVELREKLNANKREFEDATKNLSERSELYTAAATLRETKDKQAVATAKRQLDQDSANTAAWAAKVRNIVLQQVGDLPRLVTDAAVAQRMSATNEVDSFLTDLVNGQADAMKSIEDLGHSLGATWAHELAGILTNGDNVFDQLKAKWQSMKEEDGLGAALDGAGMGAMVGGVFQTSKNNASTGGAIGGAIGSIWGPVGSLVGAALGTAIGSMIQKGEDQITVSIRNATAAALGNVGSRTIGGNNNHQYTKLDLGNGAEITVDEKGISEEARQNLTTQIKRQVKATMKSWQDIVDMLPEDLKSQLERFKLTPPQLNLNGGVEDGDIRDENALQSLQDFLGNKMPKAAFAAYRDSIDAALQLLGVSMPQIQKLFQQFGELQGSELHDAVQNFFRAIIDESDIEKKLTGGKESRELYARVQLARTPVTDLRDMNSQIALGAASMGKLTDIQDLTAAQQHLNDLARQYFDASESALEGLINMQKELHDGNQSLREQVQLAGMGEQEKIDYYYQSLTDLRGQLEHATDPRDIAEIEKRMEAYVQAALGLAPGDKTNRDKLLGILADIEKIRDARIEGVKTDIVNEDLKAATALQEAAALLKGAAEALNPPGTTPGPDGPPGGGGDDPGGDGGRVIRAPGQLPIQEIDDFHDGLLVAIEDLRHLHDWQADMMDAFTHPAQVDDGSRDVAIGKAVASAVAEKLSATPFAGELLIDIDVHGTDGLIEATANRATPITVKFIQRNPDSIRSTTGNR
jgi:hypothetical protein